MKLSLVLSTQATLFKAVAFKGDFEANIAKISSWGYDGIELAIRDPNLIDTGALEKIISNHNLGVPAIGTGQAWVEERLSITSADPKVRSAAVARIKSHIPLAKQFKALIIIGLIRGITPQGQTYEQSLKYLVETLQECVAEAALNGVSLAIEPLNRYETDLIHTTAEGLDLIQQVGVGNLGLLLDTFHMNIEEPKIEESISFCGDRLFHFHVADSNRWYPGGGHLDFKSILNTLFSTGYQGWLSGEFMPIPDADTAAQRSISTLRNILNFSGDHQY